MFRSRKLLKNLGKTQKQQLPQATATAEQSEVYNLIKFTEIAKYTDNSNKQKQKQIYVEFLKALESENDLLTTMAAKSTLLTLSVGQRDQSDDAEQPLNVFAVASHKKLAPTPTPNHFKCIAEDADNSNSNSSTSKQNNSEKKKNTLENYDTFHCAARPILVMAQCCGGLMPVTGVMHASAAHLRFNFKSIPMLVTLIFLACSSMVSACQLRHLTMIEVNAKNIGLIFFVCVQLACVLFLALAVKWPQLMRLWSRTEHIFLCPPYQQPKRHLASRLRFAAIVILCCSVAEHSLYLLSSVLSYTRKQQLCAAVQSQNSTDLISISFDDFVRTNYNYVFTLLPYHTATGIFILITNGACTFVWNYMDLFIMMVSKGIAYRFEQITMRINQLADKEVSESIFVEIREHYVLVCELLEQVDDHLSGIILLSNMNNLYFVCYQLLNIFNKLRWPINYIYFWYSLLYLIGRAAFVFLCAATINDESKGALSVLRRVSQQTWCIEVERLIFQMTTQTVALTGKKFYFLTRTLLFGMAGTIVTYELVLLQFDAPNRAKGLADLCA